LQGRLGATNTARPDGLRALRFLGGSDSLGRGRKRSVTGSRLDNDMFCDV
jgi:hypothetical protein